MKNAPINKTKFHEFLGEQLIAFAKVHKDQLTLNEPMVDILEEAFAAGWNAREDHNVRRKQKE